MDKGKLEDNVFANVIVTTILFFVGDYVGKYFLDIYDTWFSFNGPALSIFIFGESIWFFVTKRISGSRIDTNNT